MPSSLVYFWEGSEGKWPHWHMEKSTGYPQGWLVPLHRGVSPSSPAVSFIAVSAGPSEEEPVTTIEIWGSSKISWKIHITLSLNHCPTNFWCSLVCISLVPWALQQGWKESWEDVWYLVWFQGVHKLIRSRDQEVHMLWGQKLIHILALVRFLEVLQSMNMFW